MTDSPSPQEILRTAEAAFSEGNHARMRQILAPLLGGDDEDDRTKAQALVDKIDPSPVGQYLFLLTAILLLAVTYFAYSH